MGDKNFIAGIGCTNVDILYSGIDRLPNEGSVTGRDFAPKISCAMLCRK